MARSQHIARRGLIAAAGAVTAALLVGAPAAMAEPPGCSAADFENTRAGVASATADYMFSHPDVNAFFSGLRGQGKDASRQQVKDFFAGNPQAQTDLAQIRQPLRDMKARCS